MDILIGCISIFKYDAIGNDIIELYNFFKSNGYNIVFYADTYDPCYTNLVINKNKLINFISEPENIFIFHYSRFWKYGEKLISNARCHIFLKYHNITPSVYFKNYSTYMSIMSRKARKQIGF